MTDGRGSFRKQWLIPIVVLTAAALVIFWGFYTVDHFVTGGDTQEYMPPAQRARLADFFSWHDLTRAERDEVVSS